MWSFSGAENKNNKFDIEFDVKRIEALLITHSHIDHIGRIPWLLAAGFTGPIYATEATAALLPLMLEDGLKIQLDLTLNNASSLHNFFSKKYVLFLMIVGRKSFY